MKPITPCTWILLGSRTEATILEMRTPISKLKLVKSFSFPKGKLKDQNVYADKPGRSKDRFGKGRHALERSSSAEEILSLQFCSELAQFLKSSRLTKAFDQLVLMLSGKMLGYLKMQIDPKTKECIVKATDLNLTKKEIVEFINTKAMKKERAG